jgi:hypothetical protein
MWVPHPPPVFGGGWDEGKKRCYFRVPFVKLNSPTTDGRNSSWLLAQQRSGA